MTIKVFFYKSVFVAGLILWAYNVINFGISDLSISDRHEFRQTQTAISVQDALQFGLSFPLHTPSLGSPWLIPFEFPIYQYSAFTVAKALNISTIPACRIVSIFFFLLSLIFLYRFLRNLAIPDSYSTYTLGICLLSPFFIFWGRAVLIESTALCFTLAFLSSTTASGELKSRMPAFLMPTMAMLTKPFSFVTAVPFALARLSGANLPGGETFRISRRFLFLSLTFALSVTVGWTHYVDRIKREHPLTAWLTSDQVRSWQFGSLRQRFEFKTWEHFFGLLSEAFGSFGTIVVTLLLMLIAIALFYAKKKKWLHLMLLMYVAPLLLITNLYLIHDYYQFANLPFLIAAFSISLFQLEDCRQIHVLVLRKACLIFIPILTILGIRQSGYLSAMPNEAREISCYNQIGSLYPRETVFIAFGSSGWDPTFPFYTRHRTIKFDRFTSELWFKEILNQRRTLGADLGPIVLSARTSAAEAEMALKTAKLLGYSRQVDLACDWVGYSQ